MVKDLVTQRVVTLLARLDAMVNTNTNTNTRSDGSDGDASSGVGGDGLLLTRSGRVST